VGEREGAGISNGGDRTPGKRCDITNAAEKGTTGE
jgi:hypothetical protein